MSLLTDRLLGPSVLNGKTQIFANQLRDNTRFTRLFMQEGRRLRVRKSATSQGEQAEWEERQFTRGLAPVVGRDSKHIAQARPTRVHRSCSVAHTKLFTDITAPELFQENATSSDMASAEQAIDEAMEEMVVAITNTIEYMAVNTLWGTLTVNSTNIPGTQVPFTISYAPNTYTASASWATPTTGLLSSEIPALKVDHYQTSGMMPARVIMGSTISNYFPSNTEITSWLAPTAGGNVAAAAATLFGQANRGFSVSDLDWEVNEANYLPAGGSVTRFIPNTDELIVLPAAGETRDVLGMALGQGYIPGGLFSTSAAGASRLVRPAPSEGWYSYATLNMDPLGVRLYVGWTGLPVLIYPNGVTLADVVP